MDLSFFASILSILVNLSKFLCALCALCALCVSVVNAFTRKESGNRTKMDHFMSSSLVMTEVFHGALLFAVRLHWDDGINMRLLWGFRGKCGWTTPGRVTIFSFSHFLLADFP